ncbi:MAG: J domain-containing protein [Pseudobdellovibrionaceae bacterium]
MKSFADVLQERLEKKIREEFQAQSSSEKRKDQPSPLSQWMTTDPAFLSQVLAQTPKFHFKKPAPRKAHRLPETLVKSYQFMISLGLDLHPGFTLNELKFAFRQGAKKTHPDHGGQGEDFRRLKDEYQRLVTFLTVKA